MKRLFVLLALSVCAFAQQPERIQRLVELKNIGYVGVQKFLEPFGVRTESSPNPRFIVLSGLKDSVDAAAAALAKIDVAPRNIEISVQILQATAKSEPDKIPADLEPVVKQLRKSFVYQGYHLADTLELRTREDKQADAFSNAPNSDSTLAPSHYSVGMRPAISSDAKGTVIRLDDFSFNARTQVHANAASTMMADAGIRQSVDVREGQKVVVGRANFNGQEGAFFLVVTAKIID